MAQRTRRHALSLAFAAVLACAALLLVHLAMPHAASACSCMAVEQPQAFESARSVFEGRVLEVVPESGERLLNRVVFEVVRTWKGANAERLEVRTSQSSASCGYGFEVGRSYLVYTYDADGEQHTGLCGRNAPMESESAAADVAAMGAGVTPVEPTREPESDVPVAPHVEEPPPLEQRSGGCASCAVGPNESAPANGSLGALGLFAVAWRARRRVRRSAKTQPL